MVRGVEWLLQHAAGGLFFRPGLKKTSIVLKVLSVLKEQHMMQHAIVVAPLRVCAITWPSELRKWTDFHGLTYVFLHGDDKERLALQDVDVYLINHDGLEWLFSENYRRYKRLNVDTLVVDESSKFRNTRTKRFRMLKPLLGRFARRWILTGTPAPKGYMNLFGQMYIVDLGRALGQFITHFRTKYFTPLDRMRWNWILQPGAAKKIEKAIAPYILSLSDDESLKIPEEVPNTIRVDLPQDVQQIYDELEEHLITELNNGHVITATSAGTVYGKCAQIANGGLYSYEDLGAAVTLRTGKRRMEHLHTAKVKAVQKLLREIGTPALIVYDFEHDLARLTAALGANTPRIGGGTNLKVSAQLVEQWNTGRLPALLVHAKAMGHGLNLQMGPGNNIIWHSLPDDFEEYEQLVFRLKRDGASYNKVYVHHIVARGTVDELKMARLRRRDRTQRGFMEALREYAKTKKTKKK